MARIRSVKPEFWSDEKVVDLDFEDRLLFLGIWNFADDQGFIECSPKRIKMQVFPGDDIEVSGGLARLLEDSLLTAYSLTSAPSRIVLRVSHWDKHQRISNPAKPRFNATDLDECVGLPGILANALEGSRVLGKGREGKGEKTPSTAPRSRRTHDDAPDFGKFWAAYPRKIGKGEARKAWAKAIKGGADVVAVIHAVEVFAKSEADTDPQYVAYPSTWLNQCRWEDEPDTRHLKAVANPGAAYVAKAPPPEVMQDPDSDAIVRWYRQDRENWEADRGAR